MKRALFILFCFLPWIARSAETENPSSDAGSVHVEPSSGGIEPGTVLTFTFPTSMIESANIDVPNQPWPFISQPEVEGEFLWKSPTEGEFRVKRVKAGAAYHFGLAPGLTDLAHQPVPAKDWSAEYKTPSFSVTTDFEARHELSAQPQLPLESTYEVRLTEVVEHTYFQDRDSRQRFPIDVIQGLEDSAQAREFRVTPREPLPVARTYDLIVDGLVDAGSQEPLSYPGVFPVGTTAPLKVEWVGAFNRALEEPMIQIKFNDEFDPAGVTPDKIRIEPAVGNLKLLADGQIVSARGDFDLTQHYVITVFPDLKGQRGYALPVQSKWGATFHPKDPCLIFPSSQLFLRALKELHFSFLQVNTGPVEWKLARIPLEKLGAVSARLSEFEQQQINPLTGKSEVDPRTGFSLMRPTDLLIQSFGLPVVSQWNGGCLKWGGRNLARDQMRIERPPAVFGPLFIGGKYHTGWRARGRQSIHHFGKQLYRVAEALPGFSDRPHRRDGRRAAGGRCCGSRGDGRKYRTAARHHRSERPGDVFPGGAFPRTATTCHAPDR